VLNSSGNIALASNPYSVAQDVASAIRLLRGELWYSKEKGVPYFQEILGRWPPMPIVREYVVRAAKTVPGVAWAKCVLLSFNARTITGQCQITDMDGNVQAVSL